MPDSTRLRMFHTTCISESGGSLLHIILMFTIGFRFTMGFAHCPLLWFRLNAPRRIPCLPLKFWGIHFGVDLLGVWKITGRFCSFQKSMVAPTMFFVDKQERNREKILRKYEKIVFCILIQPNYPVSWGVGSNHLGSETAPFWGQWFAVMANLISWSWTCDVRILPKHWPFSKGRCWNLNFHLLLYPLWVGQPQAQAIPNSNLQRQFPQTANGYRHVLHFLQQFISLFLHSQFLWKVKKSSFPWTTWKLLPNEMIW